MFRTLLCWLVCAVPAMADGSAERGRALMLEPQKSLCVLCHEGPFSELPFMGNLGPDLSDVGARLSIDEIRARIIDSRDFNPDTIMPPFQSRKDIDRVGERWKDSTILTEQEIEDIATFLSTVKGDEP